MRPLQTFAFHPNGKWLVTGDQDYQVCLWDIETGSKLRTYQSAVKPFAVVNIQPRILSLAFSPDGKLVAAGKLDGSIEVWDVETGGSRYLFQNLPFNVPTLTFAPDGQSLIYSGYRHNDTFFAPMPRIIDLRRYPQTFVSHRYGRSVSNDVRHFVSGGQDITRSEVREEEVAVGSQQSTDVIARSGSDEAISDLGIASATPGSRLAMTGKSRAEAREGSAQVQKSTRAQENTETYAPIPGAPVLLRSSRSESRADVDPRVSSERHRGSRQRGDKGSRPSSQMTNGNEYQFALPKYFSFPGFSLHGAMDVVDFQQVFGFGGQFSFGLQMEELDKIFESFRKRIFSRVEKFQQFFSRAIAQDAFCAFVLAGNAFFGLPFLRPKISLVWINSRTAFQEDRKPQHLLSFRLGQLLKNDRQNFMSFLRFHVQNLNTALHFIQQELTARLEISGDMVNGTTNYHQPLITNHGQVRAEARNLAAENGTFSAIPIEAGKSTFDVLPEASKRAEARKSVILSSGRNGNTQIDMLNMGERNPAARVEDLQTEHAPVFSDVHDNTVPDFNRFSDLSGLKSYVERIRFFIKFYFHRLTLFLEPISRYQNRLIRFLFVDDFQNVIIETLSRQISSSMSFFGVIGTGYRFFDLALTQIPLQNPFLDMFRVSESHEYQLPLLKNRQHNKPEMTNNQYNYAAKSTRSEARHAEDSTQEVFNQSAQMSSIPSKLFTSRAEARNLEAENGTFSATPIEAGKSTFDVSTETSKRAEARMLKGFNTEQKAIIEKTAHKLIMLFFSDKSVTEQNALEKDLISRIQPATLRRVIFSKTTLMTISWTLCISVLPFVFHLYKLVAVFGFFGLFALGKILDQTLNEETLGFVSNAYPEIFIGTELPGFKFERGVIHEMLHVLAKMKKIKYDSPFASAFGFLAEHTSSDPGKPQLSPYLRRPVGNLGEGMALVEKNLSPQERWGALIAKSLFSDNSENITKQDPRDFFVSLAHWLEPETRESRVLGELLSGMAYALSQKNWFGLEDAWVYLARMAKGEHPFSVEEDLNNKQKERISHSKFRSEARQESAQEHKRTGTQVEMKADAPVPYAPMLLRSRAEARYSRNNPEQSSIETRKSPRETQEAQARAEVRDDKDSLKRSSIGSARESSIRSEGLVSRAEARTISEQKRFSLTLEHVKPLIERIADTAYFRWLARDKDSRTGKNEGFEKVQWRRLIDISDRAWDLESMRREALGQLEKSNMNPEYLEKIKSETKIEIIILEYFEEVLGSLIGKLESPLKLSLKMFLLKAYPRSGEWTDSLLEEGAIEAARKEYYDIINEILKWLDPTSVLERVNSPEDYRIDVLGRPKDGDIPRMVDFRGKLIAREKKAKHRAPFAFRNERFDTMIQIGPQGLEEEEMRFLQSAFDEKPETDSAPTFYAVFFPPFSYLLIRRSVIKQRVVFDVVPGRWEKAVPNPKKMLPFFIKRVIDYYQLLDNRKPPQILLELATIPMHCNERKVLFEESYFEPGDPDFRSAATTYPVHFENVLRKIRSRSEARHLEDSNDVIPAKAGIQLDQIGRASCRERG